MEIFLLLVVIILIIIFQSTQNSKLKHLQEHIGVLQKQLNEFVKKQTETKSIEKTTEQSPVIVPQVKEEEEKNVLPFIVEEVIDESELKKETEKKNISEEKIQVFENQNPVYKKAPEIKQPQASWWERFTEKNPDLEKFIGENLLSKIAITILVLGIAFFVKYAIDKEWINETARVGIGILAGSIVMAFAHRLRLNFKAFSSVLVAGAIAVFYFTIAIAFHEYHLFTQTIAFFMMVIITAFAVFISVAYDRVELAALAITGGFAVPFMLSTGEGNYKVLFSYVLILDIGMLVLAYIRNWNLINILSYAYSVVLYAGWLAAKVIGQEGAPYKGAFIFGLVFYIVFVTMNVVNNIKEKRNFNFGELIILVSNTFVFYISGMLILHNWYPESKGIYTIALGFFNFALCATLYRIFKADKKLVYLLLGITLTFATLAAPVQLKGNYITLFWGAETALLVWLASRAGLKGFSIAAMIVSGLTLLSLTYNFGMVYGNNSDEYLQPLLNKGFVTGFLCGVFFLAASIFIRNEQRTESRINDIAFGHVVGIAGIFLLYLTGFLEIHQQSSYYLFSNSVVGVSAFYHITFTAALSVFLLYRYSKVNAIVSFILLSVNVIYYMTVYSIAPYHELQDRCTGAHGSYIAYVFHFFALIALTVQCIATIRAAVTHNDFVFKGKSLLLWIYGICAVVILSNEALLNTVTFKMHDFYRKDYYLVIDVYNYIHEQAVKIVLPVLWAIISFAFLSTGIKKQVRQLRIMALALLGLMLIKLFVYDINDVSEAGKIIAFIILGVVLLVMSFMYQKIKAMIMEEEKADDTEKNTELNPSTDEI